MRASTVIMIGLLALPAEVSGQGIRLPRPGQRTPTEPATPPPEIPIVSKALAYKRQRWSAEAYTMLSTIQTPAASGGLSSSTTFGAGTRADYRFTDRWSATMDFTASPMGGLATTETAEVGTRFSPLAWSQDYRGLRPFFDVRAAYMHMNDTYASPQQIVAGATQQVADGQRYSRGFGSVAGAGAEFPVTNTFALTTEISAMRNRMTAYRITGLSNLPSGSTYWMTSYRLTVGLKYNPLSALNLKDKQ